MSTTGYSPGMVVRIGMPSSDLPGATLGSQTSKGLKVPVMAGVHCKGSTCCSPEDILLERRGANMFFGIAFPPKARKPNLRFAETLNPKPINP